LHTRFYPSPSIFTTLPPIYILLITPRFHPFPTLHFTALPFTSLHFTSPHFYTLLDDFHFTSLPFTTLFKDFPHTFFNSPQQLRSLPSFSRSLIYRREFLTVRFLREPERPALTLRNSYVLPFSENISFGSDSKKVLFL